MYKKLLKAVQWGFLFLLLGVGTGFILSYVLSGLIGPENYLLLPVMLGVVGLISGLSSGFSKKNRKKRRRRRSRRSENPTEGMTDGNLKPFVVKPTSSQITENTSSKESPPPHGPVSLFAEQHEQLVEFEEATGARADQLQCLRVCDIRLDEEGEPMSIHLPADAREPNGREVFIVMDHHRDAVARVLKAAMKREPGNTVARLFE